ncbi:hypothetical protein, conserved [Eimeria acervulina]|uniref:Uncharacterized protein n=1 Tax=Eimeria acervulina TaxID=5801 RepID=U6GHV2_EIMAC|nr:hypothetical protein, conserved [Eimeria acervulina]CDI78154.1 hypothetical protein, conserved [Eimeria acervulina]
MTVSCDNFPWRQPHQTMNLPADGKPQVQLICERLIDKFASRLKEDTSLGLSVDTQDEFLRVKAERAKEREVETDLHREREIYSNLTIAMISFIFFMQVWREGTAERLRAQSSLFPQKESGVFSLQSERAPREEAVDGKRRRVNTGDSDDEFEDANLDTLGFETSLEHQRLRASAAELRYRGLRIVRVH